MKHGTYDPPSSGGTLDFRAGMKVGEPGVGKTVKMQGTTSTRLPMDGAPRRHKGKGSKSRKSMAY